MPFGSEDDWHSQLSPQQQVPVAQAQKPQATPGTFDAIAASFSQNNLLSMAVDRLMGPDRPREGEPGFNVKDHIPAGYEAEASRFADASSTKDVQWIKQQVDSDRIDRDIIRRSGGVGFSASLAAGVTDPLTLASFALPVAGETRAATIALNALGGAATQTAQEVAKAALGKGEGLEQSAWDVGATTFLSGVLGTIMPKIPKGELNGLLKSTERDLRTIPMNDPMLTGHSGIAGAATETEAVDSTAHDLMMAQRAEKAQKGEALDTILSSPEAKAVADLGDHKAVQAEAAASKAEIAKLSETLAVPKEQQVAEELQRLTSNPDVNAAMARRYSAEELPGVLQQRAEQSIDQMRQATESAIAQHQQVVDNATAAMARKDAIEAAQAEKAAMETPAPQEPVDVDTELPNPTIYANASGESTAGAARVGETTLEQEGADTAVGRWLTRSMVGRWSPGNRILSSPFKSARQALQKLANINTTIGKNALGIASEAPVERDLWHHLDAGTMEDLRRQDAAYAAYTERLSKSGDAPLSRMEFQEETGKAMRNGDKHATIPEITKVASQHREEINAAYKRLTDAATQEKANLQELAARDTTGEMKVDEKIAEVDRQMTDFKAGKLSESYMMRQYDHVKINANADTFHKILVSHFMKDNPELLQAEADEIAHKVAMNIRGTERGLMDWRILDGAAPESGRLKGIKLQIPDKELEPFLVNDINTLMHSYRKTVYPQALMTEKFGDRHMLGAFSDMRDEYQTGRQLLLKNLQDARAAGDQKTLDAIGGKGGQLDLYERQYKDNIRDLSAIRDRAYGFYGQPKDPGAMYIRVASGIRYVNAASKLGTATLSHFGDIGGIMMRYGMGNTIAAMAKMGSSMELAKMSMQQAQRFGAALDLFMNTHNIMNTTSALLQGYEHSGSQGKVLNALSNVTRGLTTISGETPLITLTQSLASMMGGDEIARTAGKLASGGKVPDSVLRRLAAGGLDADALKAIGKFDDLHGQDVNGIRMMNSHLWTGSEGQAAAKAVQSAILREAHSVTLRPGIADTPLHMSTWWGRSIQQFNSFAFAAQNAVLMPMVQGLSRADPRMATGLLALSGMGFLSYLTHRIAAGKEPEFNHPTRMALEIADKSNLTGAFGRFLFPLAGQVGASNISRYFDQDAENSLLGSTFQEGVDLIHRQLPGRLIGSMTGAAPENKKPLAFRRSDLHAIRKLVPANNLWWARSAIDSGEDAIGNAFNLPGKSLKQQQTQIQQD